jgi:protein-S-isoprenylcysteine O-methyltransferase Ste14
VIRRAQRTVWRTIIHISSWVAWSCYLAAFILMVIVNPHAADEISRFGVGALVLLAGVVAFFAAVIYLQRQMQLLLSTPHYGKPERLVTDGPFSLSRNPIYLAFFMPLMAMAWYSPLAAAFGLVLYIGIMTQFVIAGEERDLEGHFGDVFRDYKRQTPRWLFI